METDFQSRYAAVIIAEEKIRDHSREQIKLTRSIKVSDIIQSLLKLFS
ncbi:MAG: hypothetical protein MUQ30_00815 [Anaerolineae bacterium]|nr:hypothetical protein [Anaerolineae bacterium]